MKFKVLSLVFVSGVLLWWTSSQEEPPTSPRRHKPETPTNVEASSSDRPTLPQNQFLGKKSPSVSRQIAKSEDKEWKDQLKKLESCYETEGSCGFSQNDPKEEFFAIGQEIKTVLLRLEFDARTNDTQSGELTSVARHFLSNPDGHVKEAALHLMASQEPDLKNLDTLLKEVIQYHDARLIPIALLELTRYLGQGQDQKIHQGLTQAMLQGAPFVSLEIAKGIAPFLSSGSLSTYEMALQHLGPTSRTKWHLKITLEEFEKRQSAG